MKVKPREPRNKGWKLYLYVMERLNMMERRHWPVATFTYQDLGRVADLDLTLHRCHIATLDSYLRKREQIALINIPLVGYRVADREDLVVLRDRYAQRGSNAIHRANEYRELANLSRKSTRRAS